MRLYYYKEYALRSPWVHLDGLHRPVGWGRCPRGRGGTQCSCVERSVRRCCPRRIRQQAPKGDEREPLTDAALRAAFGPVAFPSGPWTSGAWPVGPRPHMEYRPHNDHSINPSVFGSSGASISATSHWAISGIPEPVDPVPSMRAVSPSISDTSAHHFRHG